MPRVVATIAAPQCSTCCSIAHKTFRGKTRLEAGLCQLHNLLPLLTVCLNPRVAAVSCTDGRTDRPTSHQTRHYFNIANAVTYHLSSAEVGWIQMCVVLMM